MKVDIKDKIQDWLRKEALKKAEAYKPPFIMPRMSDMVVSSFDLDETLVEKWPNRPELSLCMQRIISDGIN